MLSPHDVGTSRSLTMQTARSLATARDLDSTAVIHAAPALTTRVMWMGPERVEHVSLSARTADRDALETARGARARQMREVRSLLDHVADVMGSAPAETPTKADRPAAALVEAAGATTLLTSGFDGSKHDAGDIEAFNRFAFARMSDLIQSDEERELSGGEMSSSGFALSGSLYAASSCAGLEVPTSRRPSCLPSPTQFSKLPEPSDAEAVAAYNRRARRSARQLMAYRCFRHANLSREFEAQRERSGPSA